jgi:D-arabinose 1-dehydrogenase-like Zn-dependent alcohol dehydrogenase
MKAITVEPGKAGTACFGEIPEPDPREGAVLVEAVAVGVCGTDVEIAEGKYGWAPSGHTRLVLGHESLGRVLDPGPSSLKPSVGSSSSTASCRSGGASSPSTRSRWTLRSGSSVSSSSR